MALEQYKVDKQIELAMVKAEIDRDTKIQIA